MKKVTAVFDIGKTNKKFFLFDSELHEVHREYIQFKELEDENGHPTENLQAVCEWCKETFFRVLSEQKFEITHLNFSTYGASLVHLDAAKKPLTPLYNYTKPLPTAIKTSFFSKYGPETEFAMKTGSSYSGMLNSGMQLFWLKQHTPEVFKKIKYSLHLPQYLSYLFTGALYSEYTSIGCHTALWDYEKKDYHPWVYTEQIDKILPPIVSTKTSVEKTFDGQSINVGVGIHDSSAALIPYIQATNEAFVLVSTGTWSVTLNPFADTSFAQPSSIKDTVTYMGIDGNPVLSARIFLGNEHKLQLDFLIKKYKVAPDYYKGLAFDPEIYAMVSKNLMSHFTWSSLSNDSILNQTETSYTTFEQAYCQLITHLVALQVQSIKQVIGQQKITKIYLDGGFTTNKLYIQILAQQLQHIELWTAVDSAASALGAALVISENVDNAELLKQNYSFKRQVPLGIETNLK